MILVYIVASIFSIVMVSLFFKGTKNEYDRHIEDEEQMKWIQELNEKKGERYDKK